MDKFLLSKCDEEVWIYEKELGLKFLFRFQEFL